MGISRAARQQPPHHPGWGNVAALPTMESAIRVKAVFQFPEINRRLDPTEAMVKSGTPLLMRLSANEKEPP